MHLCRVTADSGAVYGDAVLSAKELGRRGMLLWSRFTDIYEQLRLACERQMKHPVRLYKEWHPPVFIIHMPMVFSAHVESQVSPNP